MQINKLVNRHVNTTEIKTLHTDIDKRNTEQDKTTTEELSSHKEILSVPYLKTQRHLNTIN